VTTLLNRPPLIVLVDDDIHSARLLCRTLSRMGAKRVNWQGDAARSQRLLVPACLNDSSNWPRLIIVDLKRSSTATADFMRVMRPQLPEAIPLVAMSASLERSVRESLIDAGAAAVFERHSNQAAYREEIASLVRFIDHYVPTGQEIAHQAGLLANDNEGSDTVFVRSDHTPVTWRERAVTI
jgi:CheY-like chemotaxis protein